MKRIDRVLEYVQRASRSSTSGVTTEEVAAALHLPRANASADLNALWKQGILGKTSGRPVRYYPVGQTARPHTHSDKTGAPVTVSHRRSQAPSDDPFRSMIGWKESLAAAVKRAKAAVLYPGGLHTLVTGPTGVGKSFLAELMFQFGVKSGVFRPGARLVTFNCADYANNPQLLMAHLFGVARGAYTGADREQAGLVEQANGGMLFLDEVHRLPPEGQEMFFRLIDKGFFRRLGETGPERTAQLLIVCATTEDADSALLSTFTRRIPMVITLPPLGERTLRERFKLIRRAFQTEAGKMGVPLLVVPRTLEYLLLYNCPGNVGQLKSDIQLACAQGFLRYLSDGQVPITIGPDLLPEHVRREITSIRERRDELEVLLSTCPSGLAVELDGEAPVEEQEPGFVNIYEMMEQETRALVGTGTSAEELQRRLAATVEDHFRQFLSTVQRRYQADRQELTTVIDATVLAAVEQAIAYAESRLQRSMPRRILFGLALHVQAALERIRQGTAVAYPSLETIQAQHPQEYEIAVGVVRMLSQQLKVVFPKGEAAYTTLFLTAAEEEEADVQRVALAVACHGQGVARGMAEVAEHLAGRVGVVSLDMPLNGTPDEVVKRLSAWLKQGSFSGLLLLVDMGSLSFLADRIEHATGVPVRVIPMATTILLIEAIQQAQLPGATLDQVYDSVVEAQRRLAISSLSSESQIPIILTYCFTGKGNAELLRKVVQRTLRGYGLAAEVVAVSMPPAGEWEKLFHSVLQGRRPVAMVGPVNPGLPHIPFFSSAEILTRAGQQRLVTLLDPQAAAGVVPQVTDQDLSPDELAQTLAKGVAEDFVFTNPFTLIPEAVRATDALAEVTGMTLPADVRIGLIMHIACLAERRAGERTSVTLSGFGQQGPDPVARCLAPLAHRFHVQFRPEDLEQIRDIVHSAGMKTNSAPCR